MEGVDDGEIYNARTSALWDFCDDASAGARAIFIFECVAANGQRVPPPLSYQHQGEQEGDWLALNRRIWCNINALAHLSIIIAYRP
jgi:hypothetical protein